MLLSFTLQAHEEERWYIGLFGLSPSEDMSCQYQIISRKQASVRKCQAYSSSSSTMQYLHL